MWILGIDAGGTKAHCIISDEHGHLLKEGFGGPSNYQTSGVEVTRQSLENAIQEALDCAGLKLKDIDRALFGMAGADEEADYMVLEPLVHNIMGEIPVEIVNDTWIGLRSAVEDNIGVVSICGTGGAHAGRNRKGESIILRNLDYQLGNFGGGGDLLESALHYAFRSNEQTFLKTSLEEAMLHIFGVETMDDLCNLIRREEMTPAHEFQIPIAVFQAAKNGDKVAIMLLEEMGYTEGQYAAGLIKRLSLANEKVPMVLIGSLFRAREPLLIDAYMKAVREVAPLAFPVFPTVSPAMGAIGLLIDRLKG